MTAPASRPSSFWSHATWPDGQASHDDLEHPAERVPTLLRRIDLGHHPFCRTLVQAANGVRVDRIVQFRGNIRHVRLDRSERGDMTADLHTERLE